jgi:hypothetical protein
VGHQNAISVQNQAVAGPSARVKEAGHVRSH